MPGWLSSCLGVAIDHTPAEFRYTMTTRSSRVQVQSPTSLVSPHPVFLTGIGIGFCLNRYAKTGDTFPAKRSIGGTRGAWAGAYSGQDPVCEGVVITI